MEKIKIKINNYINKLALKKFISYRIYWPMMGILKYSSEIGLKKSIKLSFALATNDGFINIKLPNIKHTIKIRTKTSDIPLIYHIFFEKEYDFPVNFDPKLIIDAGANIGLTAIFFANKFPNTKIITIEPEKSNFKLLEENTYKYPLIKNIKAGLWNKTTFLKIKSIDGSKWGFRVEETNEKDPEGIKSILLSDLLKPDQKIDILKIDIEGAEKDLFASNYKNWLDKTKIMVIELHDWLIPNSADTFHQAIKGYNFNIKKKRKNQILYKV